MKNEPNEIQFFNYVRFEYYETSNGFMEKRNITSSFLTLRQVYEKFKEKQENLINKYLNNKK